MSRAQTPDKSQTPLLNSWLTRYSGQYARVVETKGGKPVATWPSAELRRMGGGQSLPAYSDIQQIGIAGDYVYIPINTPHQMQIAAGKSIHYAVVKTHP